MSWIDEQENRVFNEDTIVKPWRIEQFISLFEYLKENGVEEFAKFASESDDLSDFDKNRLRMIEVYGWQSIAATKESWNEILNKYPNIRKFLENKNMLDRRMLCSTNYYYELFSWDLLRNPSHAITYLENMKRLVHLDADICWCPIGVSPFSQDGNGPFPWLSYATYDVTNGDEKLIFIKKYYCGVNLEYHLIHRRYTEKNGRKYRHDVFAFEYKNLDERFTMAQTANHGWVLQVINNGRRIKKMIVLQNFNMRNFINDGWTNLPSSEEVDKLDLTDEMKDYKTKDELTEIYLKSINKKSLKKSINS